jgi:hypothetical protein
MVNVSQSKHTSLFVILNYNPLLTINLPRRHIPHAVLRTPAAPAGQTLWLLMEPDRSTPRRGFGAMWCDIPENRNGLGNATDAERGFTGVMQRFENGSMLRTDSGAVYVFYDRGIWESR